MNNACGASILDQARFKGTGGSFSRVLAAAFQGVFSPDTGVSLNKPKVQRERDRLGRA